MHSLMSLVLALMLTLYEEKCRYIQSILCMTQLRIARRQIFRTT